MAYSIGTYSFSSKNLYTGFNESIKPALFAVYAPSGTHAQLYHQVTLSGLNAAGGTLSVGLRLTRSGTTFIRPSEDIDYNAGETSVMFELEAILFIDGDSDLRLTISSSNSGDTSVDVVVKQINKQQVNTGAISESTSTADALESNISNLDAASSLIKAQTDKMQFNGSNYILASAEVVSDKTGYSLTSAYDRAKNALSYTEYVVPDNTSIVLIKAKTDKMQFNVSNYILASAETVSDKTGYSLTSAYDRAKNALSYTEYTAPDNASITAIKAQTDKMQFDTSNYIYATYQASEIADAVWDALREQHTTTGTFGATSEWTGLPGSGSGAWILNIIVKEGLIPLENAKIRVLKGAENYIQETNKDGLATFALDNGIWSLRVTLSGYLGHSENISVSGDMDVNVNLTKVTVTPSEPGFVTGYATCYDSSGDIEQDVAVSCRLYSTRSYGVIGSSEVRYSISDVNGLVQFANLEPEAVYEFRREDGPWFKVTIPESATDPYELPSFIGN